MVTVSLKLLLYRPLQYVVKYVTYIRNFKVWGHTPSLQITFFFSFFSSLFAESRFCSLHLVYLVQGDSGCGFQGNQRNACGSVAAANLMEPI